MKNAIVIGVDPGASGGIAINYPEGRVSSLYAVMPDDELRDMLETLSLDPDHPHLVAFLEQVGGFIKGNPSPGSAMFRFGDGFGYIRGLLAAFRIPTHLVRPQVWQKAIPGLAGVEKVARKRKLKEHAARLFPNMKITLKTCDALLIADWGRRQLASGAL